MVMANACEKMTRRRCIGGLLLLRKAVLWRNRIWVLPCLSSRIVRANDVRVLRLQLRATMRVEA